MLLLQAAAAIRLQRPAAFCTVQQPSQARTSTEFSRDLLMKLHQSHQILLSSAVAPSRAAMWHGSQSATDNTQDSQILGPGVKHEDAGNWDLRICLVPPAF